MRRFLFTIVGISAFQSCEGGTITFFTDQTAFEAALHSSTTVDFEGLVADDDHFTVAGGIVVDTVSFTVPTGFVGIAGANVPSTQVLGAPFNSALLFSNNSHPVTANITAAGSGFTAVGGTFGNISAAGRNGTLTLTGTSGVLETRSIVTGDMGLGQPATFFGWTVTGGDSIVSATYSLDNLHPHYEGIDNFVYGFATVPEPQSTLPLLVIGLTMLCRWRSTERSGEVQRLRKTLADAIEAG